MEHPIEKITKNPQGYKYCNQCGKINKKENERCHSCRHRNFNGMDDEDGPDLLLDWEKEPDFLMEV
jgi:predicted ATP-dependent serine protease